MRTGRLRVVVMHVSTRCDQACSHCSIWKASRGAGPALNVEQRIAILKDARSAGAAAVLFTGGEPLLDPGLRSLAEEARRMGLSVQIATNGLALGRSSWLAGVVDEVYVSLEGPEPVHDSVRGRGAYARLAASVRAFARIASRPRLVARTTVSILNAGRLGEVVEAARSLDFDALSFLPIDASSEAFGGSPEARLALAPDAAGIADYHAAVEQLRIGGQLDGFVLESAAKLERFAAQFAGAAAAPKCNAPQWSSVVEADGRVRPCFFQPPVDSVGDGRTLSAIRRSREYASSLAGLGASNATCRACVCPKFTPTTADRWRERVARMLGAGENGTARERAA